MAIFATKKVTVSTSKKGVRVTPKSSGSTKSRATSSKSRKKR
jgi:hypothetical protein